ncbi:unnamed protein product, partial [Nesidiocoris tenuis]
MAHSSASKIQSLEDSIRNAASPDSTAFRNIRIDLKAISLENIMNVYIKRYLLEEFARMAIAPAIEEQDWTSYEIGIIFPTFKGKVNSEHVLHVCGVRSPELLPGACQTGDALTRKRPWDTAASAAKDAILLFQRNASRACRAESAFSCFSRLRQPGGDLAFYSSERRIPKSRNFKGQSRYSLGGEPYIGALERPQAREGKGLQFEHFPTSSATVRLELYRMKTR